MGETGESWSDVQLVKEERTVAPPLLEMLWHHPQVDQRREQR